MKTEEKDYKKLGESMRFYLYGEGVEGDREDRFDSQIKSDLERMAKRTHHKPGEQLKIADIIEYLGGEDSIVRAARHSQGLADMLFVAQEYLLDDLLEEGIENVKEVDSSEVYKWAEAKMEERFS